MEFRKVHNIMANNTRSVLVVGLGRFGSSVATTLDMMGQDVLAVDKDGELVNRWSSQIPTVQADMTDVMALEQINASDFDTAVVAIGDSVEASVITAGNLLDAGISDIWAKSVSKEHARILQRIGARHIINAETDAGKRVGHLVSGNYLDYIELAGAYNVVNIHTPAHVVGYTIVNYVFEGVVLTVHKQLYFGKCLDGCTLICPCIVTADEFDTYPPALPIRSRVNGELRQDSNTKLQIFDIDHVIHELSQGMTLKAGTIIATGTPAGVGMGMDPPQFLHPGDTVQCEIEGIGTLTNTVR